MINIMINLILLFAITLTTSCGKESFVSFKKESLPETEYSRTFQMTTNKNLLLRYKAVHVIDLREVIADFDNLPIEQESFQEIYDLLKMDQDRYSRTTVLIKSPDCEALVGYCKAVYIKR
jgi:hypothetical protein